MKKLSAKKTILIIGTLLTALLILMLMQKKAMAYVVYMPTGDYEITLGDGTFKDSKKMGDVNLDGIYSKRDKTLIAEYLKNAKSLPGYYNGDVNCDGITNTDDYNIEEENITPKREIINKFKIGTKFTLKLSKQYLFYNYENYDIENVRWESSNTQVATVDENTGDVEIVADGTCSIRAFVNNEQVDSFDFEVYNPYIYEMTWRYGTQETYLKINKQASTNNVNLSIENSINNKGAKAVYVNMRVDTDIAPNIVSKTAGWEITSSNFSNGVLKFIAEMTDENLVDNTNENSNSVKIGLNINPISKTKFGFIECYINEVTATSIDSKVATYKTHENIWVSVDNITVEQNNSDKAQAVKDKLYVKLNGTNNGEKSYATTTDLFNCLYTNSGCELVYKSRNSASEDGLVADDASVCTVEKIGLLKHSSTDDSTYVEWIYDVVVIGDIYINSTNDIDISDVVCLRKLIVGSEITDTSNSEICIEASDTDGSNISTDGKRNLGDIGDVIAIRKRIINKKWSDISD